MSYSIDELECMGMSELECMGMSELVEAMEETFGYYDDYRCWSESEMIDALSSGEL